MEGQEGYSKTVKLNNGVEMPRYGFGTLLSQNLTELVYEAVKAGVRMFDTAYVYQNEKQLGEGLAKAIKDGLAKREELFVVTKVYVTWRHDPEASLKMQLANLGLDYVDLYLDHAPKAINLDEGGVERKSPLHVFWQNMEGLVKKGLTKSIGVCNYNVQSLMNLLAFAEILPVVNQFEFHPYFTQTGLVDYCHKTNVKVMAWNSLGKNFFVGLYHSDKKLNLIEEKVILEKAKKYSKSAGQILLNWSVHHDGIIIPGTSNPNRFKENMCALDFKMTKEDAEEIDKLNINYRFGALSNVPGNDADLYA